METRHAAKRWRDVWERGWRAQDTTEILTLYATGASLQPHPFRVHYKLVGTIIAEYSRLDFSGRYLDQLSYSGRDSVDWELCYRHVHAAKTPIVGTCDLRTDGDRVIGTYEYAILPLWRGEDPAGSFVAIEVYDGISTNRIPDWSKVELKGS